jgi:single-stranded-DNA-specific exonuclease
MLGATRVTPAVPNRLVHGYGLSPGLVAELAGLEPDLLVTVDHGIACHAGIAAAKALGWRVLVTDHHLPGEQLPTADAIVNPNLRGDAFPSKMLAGVGVMFYVLLALRKKLRDGGIVANGGPDLSTLLDLVAVGTIADLVPLDVNNRALVGAGMRRLRAGQGCAGLRALIEVSGSDAARLTAADIGFAIAPRLNAAGRLEDMAIGIECLLSDDATQAGELAQVLNGINAERRGVQQQMVDEAEAALARLDDSTLQAPIALCLFDPEWHPGVVGLVASKMKEKLHRPVIAFAPSEPGSRSLRGSARSIPGFHIRDALAGVDAAYPGLIGKFGGHAMAAGLSLDESEFTRFQDAFRKQVESMMDPAMLHAELLSDGELAADEFIAANAEALRTGGPWGQGYGEPLFDGEFEVVDWRVVGERHLKLSLRIEGRRETLNAIHFGGWRDQEPESRLRLAYRLVPDDYRGGQAIQLIVEHRQAAEDAGVA